MRNGRPSLRGRKRLRRRTALAPVLTYVWYWSRSCCCLAADGADEASDWTASGGRFPDDAKAGSQRGWASLRHLKAADTGWDPSGRIASRVFADAPGSSRPEPTAQDYVDRMLKDRREARAQAQASAETAASASAESTPHQERHGREAQERNRNLIYNGKPTGGNKYPFLVSMWASDVRDGALLSPPYCHGVMVTEDVFLTHPECLAGIAFSPFVVVGDYDSSAPLKESLQLREVLFTARVGAVGLGLLDAPVTLDGFVPVAMSGEAAPPEAGENLTFVGYSGDLVAVGYPVNLNATGWPGPALEAPMQAVDNNLCSLLTGTDGSLLLCAIPADFADPAFPCGDDLGGPVLDGSYNLLGYTRFTECGYDAAPIALIVRSSFIKSAVEAAACRMSRSEDPPFSCPDLSCAVGNRQLGYPWIELYDYRPYVMVRNGFEPVSLVQFPPPGAVVRYGTSVNYTVTGTDASNRTRSCTVQVEVPPLAKCGTALVNVTTAGGASTVRVPIVPTPGRRNYFATVHQLKGRLERGLGGRGSTATARLLQGGVPQKGFITFRGNRTKGVVNQLRVPASSSYLNASGLLEVDFQVKDVVGADIIVARFDVYCQGSE